MSPLSSFVDTYLGPLKIAAAVAITATVVGLSGWALHNWAMDRADAAHKKDLIAQAATLNGECLKDKQLTEETSRAYQTQLSDLNEQLASLKRLRPNRCVPVITGDSRRDNPTPDRVQSQLPDVHGLYTDDLYDFASDAEQVGRQLDACQGFIKKTWEAKGQGSH